MEENKKPESMENLENESADNTEMMEYAIFKITARDGSEKEMAVMEEFTFENKDYAACALVENDEIVLDGMYIYELEVTEDGFTAKEITNRTTYMQVVKAYEAL